MKQYEFSARTENEAIEQGLQELGVSIADVDVQVIEEGSKGLFGLFGSRPVKVRLTLNDSEEDPLADLLEDKKPEKKAEKQPEKQPERSRKRKLNPRRKRSPLPKRRKLRRRLNPLRRLKRPRRRKP